MKGKWQRNVKWGNGMATGKGIEKGKCKVDMMTLEEEWECLRVKRKESMKERRS